MSSNSEDYPKEFAKEFANLNFAVRPARLQKIINSQAEEIQKAREILVGMNAGSLSKDYPLAKLAETAAAELTALRAKVKALEDAPRADDPKHWKEVQDYLKDRAKDLTDWEIDFLHSVKWADNLTGPQTASLRAIRDKMKPLGQSSGQALVVKRDTPEWVAWIAYKQSLGQKTAFLEKLSELTVPSLWPPTKEKAA